MKSFVVASVAISCFLSLTAVATESAYASDRELRAVLDREACIPKRLDPIQLSPTLVVYEIVCRRLDRKLVVVCQEDECALQTPRHEDDDSEKF